MSESATDDTTPIGGEVDPRFEAVREALAENLRGGKSGAAVCVIIDGRPVVDLWGGWADEGVRWRRDTLVNAYSVGKGILAILTLSLVERGLLDLDAPVSRLWPAFGAEGKGDISLRTILCHAAGLPAVRTELPRTAYLDWNLMAGALAAERPFWEPGTRFGYHVGTWGYLVGEPVCRATGVAIGNALQEHVTGALDADFHYGLPHRAHRRVARLMGMERPTQVPDPKALRELLRGSLPLKGDPEYDDMLMNAYFNPLNFSGLGVVNTEAWRMASIPSTNGHGNARAVARIYAGAIAREKPLVGKALLAEACRPHSEGQDVILDRHSCFGLGFQLPTEGRPIGPSPAAFGHFGHGGSLGFADREAGLAFGYAINLPGARWQTDEVRRLLDAVYAAL